MRYPLLPAMAVVATFGSTLPATARAQMQDATRPQIVASGQGLVRVIPDVVRIRLGFAFHGDTASSVAREASESVRAVTAALTQVDPGLEPPAVATYRVYPGRRLEGMTFVTEYHVRTSIEVVLRDLARFREAIEAALAAGASSLESVQFEAAQQDSARRSALALAVEDARTNARAMARAYGGHLGTALEISNSGYSDFAYRGSAFVGGATLADLPDTPRDIEIRAFVTTRWKLVEGPAVE